MSRRTPCRVTLSLLVISISMLPLSAQAAPAPRTGGPASIVRTMDLSRLVQRSLADLLHLVTGADCGQHHDDEGNGSGAHNREGTGIDPHGGGPGHP